MAQNTSPIFTLVPVVSWGQVTTADAVSDGTSANDVLVFTADATDGSFLQKLIFTPRSNSGAPTTAVAAARIYLNNGSTPGTATNNVLIRELGLPATVTGVTATAAVPSFEIPLNIALPPSYRIYVGITAFTANAYWMVTAVGGDY